MARVDTFYTVAPATPADFGFNWLPVLDENPAQPEDTSQIVLEVIQTEMEGQDRFTIAAPVRKDLVVEVRGDTFIDAVRVYLAALHMHMQNISAESTIVLVV